MLWDRVMKPESSTVKAIALPFPCILYNLILLLCCMFQAFVLLVIGLTTSVVVIYYAFLLPVILEYSTPWVVLHLVTAHWLLINIVFHYFKVVLTSPGGAPQVIKGLHSNFKKFLELLHNNWRVQWKKKGIRDVWLKVNIAKTAPNFACWFGLGVLCNVLSFFQ